MYIGGLIPRNFAELAEAVRIEKKVYFRVLGSLNPAASKGRVNILSVIYFFIIIFQVPA